MRPSFLIADLWNKSYGLFKKNAESKLCNCGFSLSNMGEKALNSHTTRCYFSNLFSFIVHCSCKILKKSSNNFCFCIGKNHTTFTVRFLI